MAFFLHVSPDMTAGDLVVGVGTLALAVFTAWLAWRTSAEVKVSEGQMRLSRESIEAVDRPFLVPVARTSRGVLIGTSFIAALENLGKGPALIEAIQIFSQSGNEFLEDPFEGGIRPLPPNEKLTMSLPLKVGAPAENTPLTVKSFYRSASGAKYVTISAGQVLDNETLAFSGHQRLPVDGASA